jgi:hypothetical protein
LDKVRQRKLDARAHRQEVLNPTVKKTAIQAPQPKDFNIVINKKLENKRPDVAETIKRGRGRPKKIVSDDNKKTFSKTAIVSKKKLTGKKEKR